MELDHDFYRNYLDSILNKIIINIVINIKYINF